MNKIRRLILWFIPFGYAVKIIREHNTRHGASGKVNEISVSGIWVTPYDGVFLVYSKEIHNLKLNQKIAQLQKEIAGLEACKNDY